jgi:hypothetical protein
MEVDFSAKIEGRAPASVIAVNPSSTQPATPETVSVPATVQSPGVPATSSGIGIGDFIPEFKDIILPRLNIVQNIGELTKSFPSGTIVHNQSLAIYRATKFDQKTNRTIEEGTKPLIVTVLGFRPTRFIEKVQGGGRGLLVNTEEEVMKSGGTLDYNEWKLKEKDGMKRFEPMVDGLFVVQRPDHCADDDTVFIYNVDGKKHALALWSLKGVVYTVACKSVWFAHRQLGCLKSGYPAFSYNVSTRLKPFGGTNTAWVPVPIPTQKSTPAMLDFAKSILNP